MPPLFAGQIISEFDVRLRAEVWATDRSFELSLSAEVGQPDASFSRCACAAVLRFGKSRVSHSSSQRQYRLTSVLSDGFF